MKAWARWWRFNAVGVMGMAVQMGALAAMRRWAGGHLVLCTATAVELAVLHNFAWHVQWTWRDRNEVGAGGVLARWWRFQVANGLVSVAGNAAIMPVLVRGAGLGLLAANGVAVAGCSVVNFLLAEVWAFGVKREAG